MQGISHIVTYTVLVFQTSTYRVVQSFEVVVYLFAQQMGLNETQNVTLNSLTVVTELVRQLVILLSASTMIH